MAARHANAPQGHAQAVASSLRNLVLTPTGRAFMGWRFESPPRPRGIKPQPVYVRTQDDVLGGDLLPPEDAAPTSWRSLVQLDGNELFSLELGHPADEAQAELPLQHLSKGPLGQATADAIREASRFESADEHELRILKIPSLYFMGLWLKGRRGDAVMPLEDHGSGLRARRYYTTDEVLHALQGFARQQIAAREAAGEAGREMN